MSGALDCRQAEKAQRHTRQRTASAGHRIRAVGAGVLVRAIGPLPVGLQGRGHLQAHRVAYRVDALRIDHIELFGDVAFRGQCQHQFLERGVQRRVAQHTAHGR